MVKCNQKQLLVLNKSSFASSGFGKNTCFDLINLVRCTFNSKPPNNFGTILDCPTCSNSQSHTSDSKVILSPYPEGVMVM